jgi:hypothetical protein
MTKKELETKKDKFRRLAELRTNAVLLRLKILGNCANRNTYEYTEEEAKKMFSVIEEELQIVKSKFKKAKRENFKF